MNSKTLAISRNLPLVLSMVLAVFLLASCNSTDSGTEEDVQEDNVEFEDGISLDIKELLGEELLNIIENDLEMPIHRGENPPDIVAMISESQQKQSTKKILTEVSLLMTPYLLLQTNVPSDEGVRGPGSQFIDLYLRFRNQNFENYTVDFDNVQPGFGTTFGPGSFIIGDANRFSVFGPSRETVGQDTVLTVEIFSGTVTNGEISDPYHALVMVDNAGLSNFIPNNTGRSFYDDDGVATLATWPGDQEQASPSTLKNSNSGLNNMIQDE